jgi:proton-translocating NADH-quinone oxidoreductase chain N
MMAAFFFKVGSAPFHMWLTDVYEGSLSSITAFFATVPKIILFSLILQLSCFVFKSFDSYSTLLFGFCGMSSICLASVAAIYQKRLKRLLAYSAISHSGFIIMGICCGTIDSVKACVIYIILYTVMSLATFSIVLLCSSNNITPKYIIQWAFLAKKNLLLAFTFSLTLFSIAGIPPLAGFYSKLGILISMLSQDYVFTTLIVIMFSSIGCFYYIRLIKLFFFIFSKNSFWFSVNSGVTGVVLAVVLSVITLFLVFPTFLSNLSALAALSLI